MSYSNRLERQGFNNHLLIGAYHAPPLLTIHRKVSCPNGNATTQYSGFIKDILDHLSEAVGFSFELIDVFAHRNVNQTVGPSDVLMTMMVNKEIDLTARLLVVSAERNAVIDFVTPFIVEPIVIFQPLPQWKIDFNAMFQPFQPLVWAMLLVTFLLASAILTCTTWRSKKRTSEHQLSIWKTAENVLVYMFGIFTSQGGQIGNRWLPTFFVAGSWCLVAVVIVNGYSSTLTSFLSVRSYDPIVNTWEELAKSRHLKLICERNSVIEGIIMKSSSGPMAVLAESLRKHPERRFSSFDDYIRLTKGGRFALPIAKVAAVERVFNAMKQNKGECTLTYGSPTNSYTTMHTLFTRKELDYTKAISQAILVMIDSGIMERMKSTYMEKTDKCTIDKLARHFEHKPKLRPLKLSSFHGLFIVLGIGYGLATIVFLAELAIHYAKKQKRYLLSRRRRYMTQ